MNFSLSGPGRSVEGQRVDFLVIFQIVSWNQLHQPEDSMWATPSTL